MTGRCLSGLAAAALLAVGCGEAVPIGEERGAGGSRGPSGASSGGVAPSSSSSSSTSASSASSGGGAGGSGGGLSARVLDTLSFAIVGDTRPAIVDGAPKYPTDVIRRIWQDLEDSSPRPAFAIATGDRLTAGTLLSTQWQLTTYLGARATFTSDLFPVMGEQDCDGLMTSNCGEGTLGGTTDDYSSFLSKMLGPIGQARPYYAIHFTTPSQAWTAKLVFVAANAWTSEQASWLDAELGTPTTYTFVVRHQGSSTTTAPGVLPSAQIMKLHPYTLLLAGHTPTFAYDAAAREVVVGNGGAPLTGGLDHGYVLARQRPDGAIVFEERDYLTNVVNTTFAVKADGTPAP